MFPPWVWQFVAILALLASVVVFVFGQFLINAPYRPPVDMSPMLGAGDVDIVRVVQSVCVISALGATAYLGASWRRRRSAAA